MPQTREEINAKKREKYKNLSNEDKESLKARMRINTANWSSTKKVIECDTTFLEPKIRNWMLENKCLKMSMEQMKKEKSNMLEEINSFPSFFLNCSNDHFGECCRNPKFQDTVGKTRGSSGIDYSVIIPLVGCTPFHLYTDSHMTLPKESMRDGKIHTISI